MIAPKTRGLLCTSSYSAVDFVETLIEDAVISSVSDIHIHPNESSFSVRFRIDGVLVFICECDKKIFPEVASRIKIISELRTDEQRVPQDGRFNISVSLHTVDIRVSFVPTHHGESIVLRLLIRSQHGTTLEHLGFSSSDYEKITTALQKQWGMILITGPTGSGKTTTLYSLIHHISSSEISIVTIEDPIEYALQHIKQIQVHPRMGLTFASGLRSILRQDPDVIMVGEIRDSETAHIATHTALTGHLLLSTLHTIDAATAIPRCVDMGVEPFLVASTLRVVVAQRLVRKLCGQCKTERSLFDEELILCRGVFGFVPRRVWGQSGCDHCGGSGYMGRLVISEVLSVDDRIRDLVLSHASAQNIKKQAVQNGMTTIVEDGLSKIEQGLTTISEVLGCVYE